MEVTISRQVQTISSDLIMCHTQLQVIKSTVSKSMQACQQQHNNTTYPD